MTNNEKMTLKWDIGILNKMIGLVYKSNHTVTIFNLRNLQRLLNESDFTMYASKSVIIKRVEFLKRSLEAKLDNKISDESIMITYATEDMEDEVISDITTNLPKYKQLNHSEIKYLNKMIEDRLRYGSLEGFLHDMTDIIERVSAGEFNTYAEAFIWITDWVDKFRLEMRKIKSSLNDGVIRFNDPAIQEQISDILARLGSTQGIIISGFQMLNDMLGPGYLGSRLYTYAALPANFKSGLLLQTAIDTIRYNGATYRGKKDDYKKAVVYFSMENVSEESFERAFHMVVTREDIREYSSEQIDAEMRRAGIIGNDNMELIMVYKPNRSISTADIRVFIEELEEENIEVVMLCFDYLKRIRPAEKAANEKEELKNVSNELRNIAIDFNIPIVTAAQLNRQAATIINNVVRSGKADALKEIDSSLIGSAWEKQFSAYKVTCAFSSVNCR